MYAGVPIAMPSCGQRPRSARRRLRARRCALAMPKSVTTADAAGEQDVVGLDVAVDDAAFVRVGERFRDVAEDARPLRRSAARRLGRARAQRFALDEGHRVVRESVDLAGDEDRDDVRMLEARGELDLALEAVDVDAGGEFRAGAP